MGGRTMGSRQVSDTVSRNGADTRTSNKYSLGELPKAT